MAEKDGAVVLPLPKVCPFCEHVIDNCQVVVCETHRDRTKQKPWTVHARRKGFTTRFFVTGDRAGIPFSIDCGIQSGGQDLADHIIRAANAHDALVAALKECIDWIDPEDDDLVNRDEARAAVAKAEAALKLAEGQ